MSVGLVVDLGAECAGASGVWQGSRVEREPCSVYRGPLDRLHSGAPQPRPPPLRRGGGGI